MSESTASRVDSRGYIDKQTWLESTYYRRTPHHWQLKRLEAYRYRRLSAVLADLVYRYYPNASPTICDYGCGDALNTAQLSEALTDAKYPHSITGVDISADAIEWASKKVGRGNPHVRFVVGGSEQVPSHTDIMILREVIEHLPEQTIDEVLQAARSAQLVIVTTPSVNSPLGRAHLRHYEESSLKSTLTRNGLEVIYSAGFGWRPAWLYGALLKLKTIVGQVPIVWRVMNPCWRLVRPTSAITLIAVGRRAR